MTHVRALRHNAYCLDLPTLLFCIYSEKLYQGKPPKLKSQAYSQSFPKLNGSESIDGGREYGSLRQLRALSQENK